MPVGIYFYSYATSKEKAIADANWILEQIKDYKVELPIAFDWENWSSFNKLGISLNDINDMANIFMDEQLYPKIGDFGLSRDYNAGILLINLSNLNATKNPVRLSEEN